MEFAFLEEEKYLWAWSVSPQESSDRERVVEVQKVVEVWPGMEAEGRGSTEVRAGRAKKDGARWVGLEGWVGGWGKENGDGGTKIWEWSGCF